MTGEVTFLELLCRRFLEFNSDLETQGETEADETEDDEDGEIMGDAVIFVEDVLLDELIPRISAIENLLPLLELFAAC